MTRRNCGTAHSGWIAAHFDWLAISIVGGFADHPANVRSAAVTEEPRHDAVAVHCPVHQGVLSMNEARPLLGRRMVLRECSP